MYSYGLLQQTSEYFYVSIKCNPNLISPSDSQSVNGSHFRTETWTSLMSLRRRDR